MDGALRGKKILYAASTFGHLRSFHVPYLRALSGEGADVVALASGNPKGLPEGIRYSEAPFTKSFTSAHNFAAAWQVARLLRREHFDLVLAHTSLAAFFVRLGVMLAGPSVRHRGLRVINTVHGYLFDEATPTLKRAIMLGAEKITAGVTDRIVTMNRQDTCIARRYHLCRGEVVQVDGMGVELADGIPTTEERAEARRRLRIPDNVFVLLYAAEFSKRKNQRMLIEALSRLSKEVVLALPGRGDELEVCRGLAESLGVADRVLLPGFVSGGLGDWRAAADVCVSASRSEGLPFHVIEAMASGLPVILSHVKGHEDLVGTIEGTDYQLQTGSTRAIGEVEDVSSGCPGLLYPFNDVLAFCRCVEHLRNDPLLRYEMSEAAKKEAQRYALDRVMRRVLSLYLAESVRGCYPTF